MKVLPYLSLAVVVAIVAIPQALGQHAADRPPGVAANGWVSINENLGTRAGSLAAGRETSGAYQSTSLVTRAAFKWLFYGSTRGSLDAPGRC